MPSETEILSRLTANPEENTWAAGRAPQLTRIFNLLMTIAQPLGPTLDIGSGNGAFYRIFEGFAPNLLPYSCADINGEDIHLSNTTIQVHRFECDKDHLPVPDQTYGMVLLCDVLEHLIVDPVWTLLEINRVTRIGGHFLISTPNVTSIDRVLTIAQGRHPGTEHEYKPTSIYDRHNREWTPSEVFSCVGALGFRLLGWDSNFLALSDASKLLLQTFRTAGLLRLDDVFFGPELVFVFEKTEHKTLNSELPIETRWPSYLYTGYSNYRQRPKKFPICTSE